MPEKKSDPFVLTNTHSGLISIAGQDILPGHTSQPFDEKKIPAIKKSAAYRSGKLKEGVVAMPPPEVPKIEKLSPEQAIKLIGTESNLSVLQAWAEAEKRPEVLAAVSERVKLL